MGNPVTGRYGGVYHSIRSCLLFDASGEKITVSNPGGGELDFAHTQDFSIAMWFHATGNGPLIYKTTGATGVNLLGYGLQIASGLLKFTVGDGTAGDVSITGGTTVTDSLWHHVVAHYDATNTQIRLFLDGASDAALVDTGGLGTFVNSADLLWGTTSNAINMGRTRIFSTALTAANSLQMARGRRLGSVGASVVGEWTLAEGSSATTRDWSGNGNDGTIASATWVTTTVDAVSETPAGLVNSSNKSYQLAARATAVPPNAMPTGITVTVNGSPIDRNKFTLTPKGAIVVTVAPTASITVTYNDARMTLEAGGFTDWSLDFAHDLLEVTGFDPPGGAREHKPSGINAWTAAGDQKWVDSGLIHDMEAPGTIFLFKLFISQETPMYFSGWALLDSESMSVNFAEVVGNTINIMSTYELSNETSY